MTLKNVSGTLSLNYTYSLEVYLCPGDYLQRPMPCQTSIAKFLDKLHIFYLVLLVETIQENKVLSTKHIHLTICMYGL